MCFQTKTRFQFVLLCLILTLTVALITGCTTNKSTGSSHIRYALGAEPESLDPRMSTSIMASNVQAQIFEGLTSLDAQSRPVAAAAERWEISPDGLRLTFTLRAGLKWSNGDPVTAHDFEYAWKTGLDPALATPNAYMLYCIKNGEAYATKKVDVTQVGVRAKDDRTLEVELEQPTAYFLSLTAFHAYYPIHKKLSASNEKWATQSATLIGNGPFKMTQWVKASRMEFVKNEHYWDAAKVRSTKLEFFLLDNASTALSMFESNQLDLADVVPASEVPRLLKENKVILHPFLSTSFVSFQAVKPPFNDARVRKAFTLAIDRSALTDKILRGGQKPAFAFVPPGLADVVATDDFRVKGGNLFTDNDIATAKRLLSDAGYPEGKGFPTVTFLFNTSESNKTIAEALQEMWKKNLGVSVSLSNQEWKVYWDSLDRHDFQLARERWSGDYPDPMTFIDLFVSGGSNNSPDYRNSNYDAFVSAARTTIDAASRMRAMHSAEKLLMDEAVIAPLYFDTSAVLQRPYVKGVLRSILGVVYFKDAYRTP